MRKHIISNVVEEMVSLGESSKKLTCYFWIAADVDVAVANFVAAVRTYCSRKMIV